MTAYQLAHPEAMKAMMAAMRLPFDDRISILEKDPGGASVLEANGLTAREYSYGVVALRAAAWAAGGAQAGLADLALPANVARLKANPGVLERFGKAESGRVQR